MSEAFLNGFYPKILDVQLREREFWQHRGPVVSRHPAALHNISYVLGGKGAIEVNKIRHELAPGHCYYIKPGDMFDLITDTEHTLEYITVHFRYRLVEWDGMELAMSAEESRKVPLPAVWETADRTGYPHVFGHLLDTWSAKRSGYERKARTELCALMESLLAETDRIGLDDAVQYADLINACIVDICQDCRLPHSRTDMARKLAVSPTYLSILFKKHTGYSLQQYIRKVRLDKAKHLLKTTLLPIGLVADEVGYADPLYFSRLFAHETGLSPTEYRKG